MAVNNDTSDPVALSVIAPCFNEAENVDLLCTRTVAAFDSADVPAELILVDDGSTDGTWERILWCAERDSRVRGIRHTCNQGMESAWRTGLETARGRLVCLIDADLQNRPEDIARLYAHYQQNQHDVVQAVRHPARGLRRGRTFSRGLNFVLNFTFRMRMRDNKSGFVLTQRAVMESLLTHHYNYRYFQCLIGVAAKVQGFTVAEVDTNFDERHGGESFLARFPIGVSLRALWELVKYRIETLCVAGGRAKSAPDSWVLPGILTDTTRGDN